MDCVTYLETGSHDPFFNLAFEEYVLRKRTVGSYLLLWQNDRAVVIGQNQNAEEEINRSFMEAHGIAVVRRSTGGGAVYHDLGNLNYSFVTDADGPDFLDLRRFILPVAEALKGLGLHAEISGRNDVLAEGRKVSGSAQRLLKGRLLHHGTLLFDSDLDMAAGALRADPEKFRSKSSKSVRSRIGNIRGFLKDDMSLAEFWAYLKGVLSENGLRPGSLSPDELLAVRALKKNKYDTWEWNFGRSPKYNVCDRRRWDGGSLEVRAEVRDGKIAEIAFYGDFLAVSSLAELTDALTGCPFERSAVGAVLDRFPVSALFGGITAAEILQTVF